MKIKFTNAHVAMLKPNGKRQWISDEIMKGLTLCIGATGSKVWYYYFRDVEGKKASRKLGSAQVVTVAQARRMVKDFGGKVALGEDIRKKKIRNARLNNDELMNKEGDLRITHTIILCGANVFNPQTNCINYKSEKLMYDLVPPEAFQSDGDRTYSYSHAERCTHWQYCTGQCLWPEEFQP